MKAESLALQSQDGPVLENLRLGAALVHFQGQSPFLVVHYWHPVSLVHAPQQEGSKHLCPVAMENVDARVICNSLCNEFEKKVGTGLCL